MASSWGMTAWRMRLRVQSLSRLVVGDVVQSQLLAGGQNVPLGEVQKGTVDQLDLLVGPVPQQTGGGDAPHASRAAAADQLGQHRLQIVVGVVGGEQDPDFALIHDPAEETVPRLAGGGLHALARLFGHGGNIHPLGNQLHPKTLTDPLTEGQIPIRLLPAYAVVEVEGGHVAPPLLAKPLQKGADGQLQKESGIRAAREGDGIGGGVGKSEGKHSGILISMRTGIRREPDPRLPVCGTWCTYRPSPS